MLDILLKSLPEILTALLAIGVVWKLMGKVLVVLKEVADLLQAVFVALEDKKLTQEEIDKIIEEAKDIPPAVRAVLKKGA